MFGEVVHTDPLDDMPVGGRVLVQRIGPAQASSGSRSPQAVSNWEYFRGAILVVCLERRDGSVEAMGTAVVIAPGLAMTATHVYVDELDDIEAGGTVVFCVGSADGAPQYWHVEGGVHALSGDISYLALRLGAPPVDPQVLTIAVFALTTRTPEIGEHVHVVGYRWEDVTLSESKHLQLAEGSLFVARGDVLEVHYPYRDLVLATGPTIVIGCETLGAMSGGAVIDARGVLLGLISSGHSDGGQGTTTAAWVVGALPMAMRLPWPKGVYRDGSQALMEIPDDLLWIERREAVQVISTDQGPELDLRQWSLWPSLISNNDV